MLSKTIWATEAEKCGNFGGTTHKKMAEKLFCMLYKCNLRLSWSTVEFIIQPTVSNISLDDQWPTQPTENAE